jgi:predicted outer membrane repeat protein
MNIKAGTAKAGAPKYYSYGSYVSNINPYNLSVSGTLDLANNYVEVMGLGLLDFSDQGKVVLDADLGTNSMDWFDVYKISDNFGKINVKDINILSESSLVDGATNHVPFIIGADVSNKMTFPTLFTSTNRYDLASNYYLTNTLVDFTKRENQGGFVNLSKYSPIEKENISYSMTLDEHLTENLKPFSSNIKSVTIRGNNHNISSDGTSGFQLGNTQTLELKDIGTVSGFKGSNGSFLYNGGTAEIARAAFKNNSSTSNGGVISTSGILNITDSDFINNKANGQGGAIYAASGATVNIYANEKDVTFSGNTASGFTNSIYMDNSSILNLNPASDKKISIAGISGSSAGYSININKGQKDGGIVELTDRVTNATANGGVHLYGGTLRLTNDSFLNMNDLSLHGCTLDMANGFTGTMYLRGLSLGSQQEYR